MVNERKWLPHFGELIDRLTIHQLKEVFIPEHKEKYAHEMTQIMHDIDLLIEEKKVVASSELIRAIVVIAQMDTHIWYNESKARQGNSQDPSLLQLTHGLNGLRNNAQNFILELIGQIERKDYKTDCLAAQFHEWEISLTKYREEVQSEDLTTGDH